MSYLVAFVGCPNVGKSTVFNALTGLRQHTGNWTGKTVDPARGHWILEGERFEAVDLPGIYSLEGGTPEERVASDWLKAKEPDVVVAVLDATAIERSLALGLELRPRCGKLILCLNLCDEAERLGLRVDEAALSAALRAPVVPTRGDRKSSYERLRRTIALSAKTSPARRGGEPPPQGDGGGVAPITQTASELCNSIIIHPGRPRRDWDRLLLGKFTAYPLVLVLLFVLFWLTIRGANYPSALLEGALTGLGEVLAKLLSFLPAAPRGLLLEGVYATAAKVVSVMLPPMAIFFPLFSLLEDLGFLPRTALLLDRPFAACGSCGRQGLCMCMGLGCNAVGVTGCRIIPNEKARLAAILTNALTPCNGRFPTLILLAALMLGRGGGLNALAAAGVLTGCMVLSGTATLLTTALLRRTLLRGEEGSLALELPPFRKPRLGQLLVRSLLDRTLKILGRALSVAAPAGAVIWLLSRITMDGAPLLALLARGLDPAAVFLGMNGTLLLAFLLSFPANELLLPLALFLFSAQTGGPAFSGGLALGRSPAGEDALTALFSAGGAPLKTALCTAIFTLFHWPCSTTVLTVRRETGSLKWTALAVLLPTALGCLLCAAVNLAFDILG